MTANVSKLKTELLALGFSSPQRRQISLMVLAVIVGVVSGHAAVGFYLSIDALIQLFFGATEANLATGAKGLPWWHIMLATVGAGLIVGQLLRLLGKWRASGVPDVIESAALKGSRLSLKDGIISAAITVISLGGGAATGREGPVAHLGASIAGWITETLNFRPDVARTLLGCSVAAAVAASFNAPIAGVFFALEVIIGHYALHTFTPIVISAIAGVITSRAYLGDFPAFTLGDYIIQSSWEFPAFALLGVISALIAIIFIRTSSWTDTLREKLFHWVPMPLMPALGGVFLAGIAIIYPEILSVGYEATSLAIGGQYGLGLMLALLIAKFAATNITLAFRFGGGVFSPALFLGAMAGGSFGLIAALVFPELASDHGVYAIAGMGAVASSVLGAPISTTLMVFEITGDYSITIAVMIASAMASTTSTLVGQRSFFHTALAARNIFLEGGRATYLLKSARVRDHMDRDFVTLNEAASGHDARDILLMQNGAILIVTSDDGRMVGTLALQDLPRDIFDDNRADNYITSQLVRTDIPVTFPDDALETALKHLDSHMDPVIPVVSNADSAIVVGLIRHRTVMSEYNRALLESHGQDEAK